MSYENGLMCIVGVWEYLLIAFCILLSMDLNYQQCTKSHRDAERALVPTDTNS